MNDNSKSIISFVLVMLSTVFAALPACCEESGSSPDSFYIGDIVIEADYEDYEIEKIKDSPVQTAVIRREDFENKFTSLSEVLSEQAGVEIKSYGGFGNFSTVSIRGVSSDKVLIMIDGIPLNLGLGGAVNIGDLPLKNLERIEIYKGHVPAEFGMNAIGGVVNIVTIKKSKISTGSFSLSAGDYNTRTFDIFAGASTTDLDLSFSYLNRRSDGDFEYLNDMGTSYNQSDDRILSRSNNWFRDNHLVLNMKYDIDSDRSITFGDRWSLKEQGLPGPANAPALYANLKTLNHSLDLKYRDITGIGENTELGFDLQWRKYETRFNDLFTNSGEIGLGRQDNRNTTKSLAVSAMFDSFRGNNHEVYGSLWRTREHYQPRDKTQAVEVGMSSRRQSWIGKLEYRYRTDDDDMLITAAAGRQHVESSLPGDTPSAVWAISPDHVDKMKLSDYHLGLRWRASNRLTVKANAGKYFRIPGFYELFGDRGGVIGNTDLLPEKGRNIDLGLSFDLAPGRRNTVLDITYFDQDIDNVIVFVQNSQFVAYAVNLTNARVRGVELSLNTDISPSWSLNANYTHQDSRNGGDLAYARDKKLPGRYEHSWNASLKWKKNNFEIYNSLDITSATFTDEANLNKVEPSTVHNAGINYSFRKWIVSLDVKNIGNNTISDVNGYPLPGRSYFFTVKRLF